jgi:hypothetical protein
MCAQTSERRYLFIAPSIDHLNAGIMAHTFIRQAGLENEVSIELVVTEEDGARLKERLKQR